MAKVKKGAYALFWSTLVVCFLVARRLLGTAIMGGLVGFTVVYPAMLMLSAFTAALLARLFPQHVGKLIALTAAVALALALV